MPYLFYSYQKPFLGKATPLRKKRHKILFNEFLKQGFVGGVSIIPKIKNRLVFLLNGRFKKYSRNYRYKKSRTIDVKKMHLIHVFLQSSGFTFIKKEKNTNAVTYFSVVN